MKLNRCPKCGSTFEDALAELINETWFCLTEEEQVRGILNEF